MIMDVKKETSSELKNISKTNILQYLSCSSPSAAPLPHCSPSADMVIHCRDGRLAGHRLVLASISGMLHEELLCNSADDLTSVMMPDFTLDQVSSYLHHVYACQDVEKFQEINDALGYKLLVLNRGYEETTQLDHAMTETEIKLDEPLADEEDLKESPNTIPLIRKRKNKTQKTSAGKKYRCFECGIDYKCHSGYYGHIRSVHEGKCHTCPECGKSFTTAYSLRNHTEALHNEIQYTCDHCGKQCNNRVALRDHTCLPPCPKCGEQFPSHRSLNHHYKTVHEETLRKYPTSSFVWDHFTKDKETGMSVCHHCGKHVSAAFSSVAFHFKKFHDENSSEFQENFPCLECGMIFTSKTSHYMHRRSEHEGVDFSCQCSQCGKQFSLKNHLKIHIETVHEGIKYTCSECGKQVNSKSSLTKHMRTHTGVKPHQCSECGRKFAQRGQLRTHMRVHTGETPYHCDICGQRFKHFSAKKNHKCRL